MKKKNSKLSGFYLGLIFVLMYLPIAVVIVFSFNESKLPVRFTGFSLKWYQELIHDDAMIEALGNSLFLGVVSCLVSAVIGTLGAVGLSRIHWKTKGILEYISILPLMIPEIILGMVLMAFFYMMNLPFVFCLSSCCFIVFLHSAIPYILFYRILHILNVTFLIEYWCIAFCNLFCFLSAILKKFIYSQCQKLRR